MRVLVLGPVVVADANGTTTRPGPRETILLAVLAAHVGERVSIDTLIDAMWPDVRPRTALKTLHGHVHRMRKVLGARAIEQHHGGYVLMDAEVSVDSNEVARLVAQATDWARRGDPDKSVVLLREALALFRGRPFEGIDVEAVHAEAQRLGEVRLEAVEAMFDSELAAGRHRDVVSELKAYSNVHPLREHASAQLMIALYRCGRQAEALAAYHRARTHLARELGLEPGPVLRALEAAVLSHDPSLDAPRQEHDQTARGGSRLTRAHPSDFESAAIVGFIGRGKEVARCDSALNDSVGRSLVSITGPPGIGKSRFAAVVAGRARHAGWTVVDVSCNEHLGHPYGLVVEVVRSVFSLSGAGGPNIDPIVASRIARLAPDLMPDIVVTSPLVGVDRDADRATVIDAVDQIVTAALDQPLLIVVDDLQWADSQSLVVFKHLVRSQRSGRLAVLATCRDYLDDAPVELLELFADTDRARRHQRVPLTMLTQAELEALVRVTTGHDDAVLAEALNVKTDGNPLLALALLQASAGETGADMDTLLPMSIAELVGAKVKRLPGLARDVIDVAALIGREFSIATVGNVLDNRDLDATVEPLLASGILVDARSVQADLAFAHDLYREAVGRRRPLPWRRRIHGQLAAVLPRSDELLDSVCHHARLAGDPFVLVEVLVARARRRAAMLLVDESLTDTAEALDSLDRCEPEPAGLRAEILELTGDTLMLCGRRDDACAAFTAARESTPLGRWQLARLHRKEAKCHRLSRQLDETVRSITAAHELAGDLVPDEEVAFDIWLDVELEIGWFDFSTWHALPWAHGRLQRTIEVIEPRIPANQRVNLLHCRSLTVAKTNQWRRDATASAYADRALEVAYTHGDHARLAEAHFGAGFLGLWTGDLDKASTSIDAALRLFRITGDRNWETLSLVYLAVAARFRNDRAGTGELLGQLSAAVLSTVAPVYRSAATATRSWCALRDGNVDEAGALAGQALAGWTGPYDRVYSFQGLAAWPALAVATARRDIDNVVDLSALLVRGGQIALPDDITRTLDHAAQSSDPTAAEPALPWARDHGWA